MAVKYGENGFSGASSDTPGNKTESALAAELRAKQTGLDEVIATGGRKSDDPSFFSAPGRRPTPAVHDRMKDANAGGAPSGTVPGGVVGNVPGPVRPSSKRI